MGLLGAARLAQLAQHKEAAFFQICRRGCRWNRPIDRMPGVLLTMRRAAKRSARFISSFCL
ncbi:hypothetical protein DMH17_09360 [Raoultella planticola]|nr:hypothetical protein [Raoultella planticola]